MVRVRSAEVMLEASIRNCKLKPMKKKRANFCSMWNKYFFCKIRLSPRSAPINLNISHPMLQIISVNSIINSCAIPKVRRDTYQIPCKSAMLDKP